MWIQKAEIYNKSCGQIGNLHNRGQHPKITLYSSFFYLEEAYENTWKFRLIKDLNSMGAARQIAHRHKEFSLGQKIPSLSRINIF